MLTRLQSLCSGWTPRELLLADVSVLGGAVCLIPDRNDWLRSITSAIGEEWPHLADQEDRVYHLTVAREAAVIEEALRALRPQLPIRAVCRELILLERRAAGVRNLGRFVFGR